MGKKLRRREEKRKAADAAVAAVLSRHSKKFVAPRAAAALAEFSAERQAAIGRFRWQELRPPAEWRCAIRSRDADRRFIELVRFVFARYPAPRHLENAWIAEPLYELAGHDRHRAAAPRPDRCVDLRAWHITVAQGGSLHRRATGAFFSKAETHHFLAAPPALASAARAFWYAVARAQADDRCRAEVIAASRLAEFSIGSAFWRETARFFVRNPAPLATMNDLIDYLAAEREADPRFSLKGRTLAALARRMEEWHRALRRQQAVCGGSWEGYPLPDAAYEAGGENNRAIWRFRQIKTGNALFREGQRMHHCVATYKGRCMAGETSIWSLTSEFPLGKLNRGLTLELRRGGAIVQARGFANRLPHANEAAMVRRWAVDHGLDWTAM